MRKGARESRKVEAAAIKLDKEAEERREKMWTRLDKAEARKAEAFGRQVAANQMRQIEAQERLRMNEEAVLERGVSEARREIAAIEIKEEKLAEVQAKASKTTQKVEAVNAKLSADKEAAAAKLSERLAAAEARKAEVRYPPCARVKSVAVGGDANGRKQANGFVRATQAVFAGIVGGALLKGLATMGTKFFTHAALLPLQNLGKMMQFKK